MKIGSYHTSMLRLLTSGSRSSLNQTLSSKSEVTWAPFTYNFTLKNTETATRYTPHTADDYLVLVSMPTIILLGILGNILSVTIMLRKKFREMSTSVYLLCLAFVDTICLVSNGMTNKWLMLVSGVSFHDASNTGCQIVQYLISLSRSLSAWFVVAVTVERFLAVKFPLKSKRFISRTKAWIVVIVITLGMSSGNVYIIIMTELNEFSICAWKEKYIVDGLAVVVNSIDLMVYALLPSTVLIACNAYLIWKLTERIRFRAKVAVSATSGNYWDQEKLGMTRMLIAVSATYTILTFPIGVYHLALSAGSSIGSTSLYNISYILETLNHAMNFFLYCVAGSGFRREIRSVIHRCKQ